MQSNEDDDVERKLERLVANLPKKQNLFGVTTYLYGSNWRSKDGLRTVLKTARSNKEKYKQSKAGQAKIKEYNARPDVLLKKNESKKLHRQLQKEEGPFACTYPKCDKLFGLRERLTNHIKCVHGPGPSTHSDYRNTALDYKQKITIRESDIDTDDEEISAAVEHRRIKAEWFESRIRNALVYLVVVVPKKCCTEVDEIGLKSFIAKHCADANVRLDWYVGKNVQTRTGIQQYHYKLETSPLHTAIRDGSSLFLVKTYKFETDDKQFNHSSAKDLEAYIIDAEIIKLQKMLESNSSTSSSDLSMLQSIKHEIAIVNECMSGQKKSSDTRTPSIGGGLPLLLLSVLPPVIPRASWPSSDHCTINPMRQSVTFSSQPQLDNEGRPSGVTRLPAIDLFNLRLTHQQATAEARTGILDRIKGMFVSSNRKDSTISYTEASQALRRHMTRLTGIVSYQATSSCNTLNTSNKNLNNQMVAKSGTAINISYPSNDELTSIIKPPFIISNNLNEPSDAITSEMESEPEARVFFQLPKNRRPSILHQTSQPTLRERVKGSPRFPHRIAPTSSLGALQEGAYNVSTIELGDANSTSNSKTKWKSMEESTFSTTTISNSSTSTTPAIRNQMKPPVQLTLPIKNETQTSSNDNDDDDDDVDCEKGKNDGNEDDIEHNHVERQRESDLDL